MKVNIEYEAARREKLLVLPLFKRSGGWLTHSGAEKDRNREIFSSRILYSAEDLCPYQAHPSERPALYGRVPPFKLNNWFQQTLIFSMFF
jgi:hypothetical protein